MYPHICSNNDFFIVPISSFNKLVNEVLLLTNIVKENENNNQCTDYKKYQEKPFTVFLGINF